MAIGGFTLGTCSALEEELSHLVGQTYAPINSKLQHPPRAFVCASCPERGEFERYVGRVENLNRIYLLF